MSIDMTGWQRLSAVGRDKQLSQLPRGGAPKGVQFAIKIKKAQWIEGQYVLDVTVRTLDLSLILAGTVWKLWPSMLPEELQEALDCDDADGIWWLLETEENKKSKTNRTKFCLLDTQQGLDASGLPKPRAGGEPEVADKCSTDLSVPHRVPQQQQDTQPLATSAPKGKDPFIGGPLSNAPAACPHSRAGAIGLKQNAITGEKAFICSDCGERVG